MKKAFTILSFVLISLMLATSPVFATVHPPEEEGVLPEMILTVPEESDHQKYLGITGKKTFIAPQIKAEVVIIEIFSMYCPYCQKDAPVVNELYEKIAKDENLRDRVKLIGIGAGNSAFEVGFFRKTYNISFPLFPDDDFSIHKKLGQVRTPYFIGIKIKKDGTYRIFYSKRGAIEDAGKFLNLMLRLSEI